MAAVAEPLLMTVEQFRELPEREDVIQELQWGQVVTLAPPKWGHTKLQHRLVELLRPKAKHKGMVASEVPFRALPEYELRVADVAFVSQERWDAADDNDNLHGSPDLIIEVLSPSNTKTEMRERAVFFLSTGAEEFWVVDPKRKNVTVMRQQGAATYEMGDSIPLAVFGGELGVREIFE
jgi:Uma2 family endonuclease